MQASTKGPQNIWIMDSGCSRHMTGIKSLLTDFKSERHGNVTFAGNHGGEITGLGNITNGKLTLERVFYVDRLEHNLIAVSQICDKQHTVHFTDKVVL